MWNTKPARIHISDMPLTRHVTAFEATGARFVETQFFRVRFWMRPRQGLGFQFRISVIASLRMFHRLIDQELAVARNGVLLFIGSTLSASVTGNRATAFPPGMPRLKRSTPPSVCHPVQQNRSPCRRSAIAADSAACGHLPFCGWLGKRLYDDFGPARFVRLIRHPSPVGRKLSVQFIVGRVDNHFGLRSAPLIGRAHKSFPVFGSASAYKRNRPSFDQSCGTLSFGVSSSNSSALPTHGLDVQFEGAFPLRREGDTRPVRRPDRHHNRLPDRMSIA